MLAIEFQTTLKEIITAVPMQQRHELLSYTEDEQVRVIVLTSPVPSPPAIVPPLDRLTDARDKGYTDFLEYLMDYPVAVDQPIRWTREELHER